MRASMLILALPLVALSACGGGGGAGPTTLGTIAPVISGNGTAANDTSGATASASNFLDVVTTTSYDAIAGTQAFRIDGKTRAQLYEGDAGTVASPTGSVSYNPRDGVFTLTLANPIGDASVDYRFQDPLHRITSASAFSTAEVPSLASFNYLQSSSTDGTTGKTNTFFYQRPGSDTTWVSLAGFATTTLDSVSGDYTTEHAAMVFGTKTVSLQVPTSGSGSYAGGFLASMVVQANGAPITQWMSGTSAVNVNFGTGSVGLAVTGTVLDSHQTSDGQLVSLASAALLVPVGSTFQAEGSAAIGSFTNAFSGKIASAAFATPAKTALSVDVAAASAGTAIAGASSIDGAFYGPNAAEVGGNLRIVGGIAGQRIDIHGAFTGRR